MSNSFATPSTIPCKAPLSMGFPRQKYWSRLPFPPSWDLPDPGIEPMSLALACRSFYLWATREALIIVIANTFWTILSIYTRHYSYFRGLGLCYEECIKHLGEGIFTEMTFCILALQRCVCFKRSMQWDKCSGLVHWEDPERLVGAGGGRGDQDGEHM